MPFLQRVLRAVGAGCCLLTAILATRLDAAEEPLAIVATPAAQHDDIDREELAAIFGRKKRYWKDGAHIEPVNLLASDSRRRQFSKLIFGLMPEQMDGYWNEMYFHGVLPPYVVPSIEAVLRFVSTTPGAIGYVPLCSADKRVDLLLAIDQSGALLHRPPLSACHQPVPAPQ